LCRGGRLSHGRLGGDFPDEGGENILSPRRHSRGAEISRDTGERTVVHVGLPSCRIKIAYIWSGSHVNYSTLLYPPLSPISTRVSRCKHKPVHHYVSQIAGDLVTYKLVGNFPSSPPKFPTSPSYFNLFAPPVYFALLDVIYNNNNWTFNTAALYKMSCIIISSILIYLFIYELFMSYYYRQNTDQRLETCAGHFLLN